EWIHNLLKTLWQTCESDKDGKSEDGKVAVFRIFLGKPWLGILTKKWMVPGTTHFLPIPI
ncbi:hypothetical protein, partial [Enterococcus faecium]|uniref:hypothetical protein n=1 Tax=Enterococcus faecium TaxID=1352 RepID=UPI0030C87858